MRDVISHSIPFSGNLLKSRVCIIENTGRKLRRISISIFLVSINETKGRGWRSWSERSGVNKRDIRRFLITLIRSCLRSGEISLWGGLLVCRLLTRFWNIWCGKYSIFLFPGFFLCTCKHVRLLERKFLNQSIRSVNFYERKLKKLILIISLTFLRISRSGFI